MKATAWYQQMLNRIQQMEQDLEPLILAATSTVSEMGERIFEEGRASNGGKIGKYSNKGGFWTEIDKLPKKPKKFRKKTKDGERVYYPSYVALREEMGRQTNFVDLRFSGRLAMNFLGSSVSSTGRDISGMKAEVKKLEKKNTVGITLRPENFEKAEDNEARFKKVIFGLTKNERKAFRHVFKNEVLKRLAE